MGRNCSELALAKAEVACCVGGMVRLRLWEMLNTETGSFTEG